MGNKGTFLDTTTSRLTEFDMPEARPMQTYSTLLEDRRIIDAAAEAGEAPSLVVHLLEKEWSIRPGQAPAGSVRRHFTYSQPVSVCIKALNCPYL